MKKDKSNVIDKIEARLQQLEREKDEIEKLYEIDEELLKENTIKMMKTKSSNAQNDNIYVNNKDLNNIQSKVNFQNLPKLEPTMKEKKQSKYKMPESHAESLKYEPSLNDLYSIEEFEPSFTNLANLKIQPSIPKSNTSILVEYLNRGSNSLIDNYIL